MMTGAKETVPVRLDFTIPGDRRFCQTLRVLCVRIAEYVGYPGDQAEAIGGAIDEAVCQMAFPALAEGYGSVGTRFQQGDQCLEVTVSYPSEHAVTDAPLEVVRQVMDTVEVGRHGGRAYCRMTRRLPAR